MQDGSNPLKIILGELGTNTLVVTNSYLEKICKLCASAGLELPGTLYAVYLLNFLQEQGCIDIDVQLSRVKITGLFTYE